jgi:hypothetical protein
MITGQEIIEYAGKIAARDAASEAGQRAAVNRAYYGAFHVARAFLGDLGIRASARHDAQLYLQCCTSPDAKLAGLVLADLQSERVRADYDLTRFGKPGVEPTAFVRECVAMAADVQSLLRRCGDEVSRASMKTDMEAYLRRRNGSSR